jgi:hypothetical protein
MEIAKASVSDDVSVNPEWNAVAPPTCIDKNSAHPTVQVVAPFTLSISKRRLARTRTPRASTRSCPMTTISEQVSYSRVFGCGEMHRLGHAFPILVDKVGAVVRLQGEREIVPDIHAGEPA